MGNGLDTSLLRRTAKMLTNVSEDMRIYTRNVYQQIGQCTEDELIGEYADAIVQRTDSAKDQCRKCETQLDELGKLLENFAAQLDLADEKARESITEK